mgnify:CR=1 FL=1
MAKPKVGLQLIVYGGRPGSDLAGVLREVAEVGYAGIESGNMFQMADPKAVQDWLAETGLQVCGMHSGYGDQSDPAAIERNIAFLKAVESNYLICSGVAQGEGIERFEKAAPTFNKIGKICRDAGLYFCYHNHDWEFKAFNGVKGIHRLCELTDPALVKLCVDVYWVTIGGEKPAEFVQRYAERAIYFHFKDGAPGSFMELGTGTVDLVAAKDAAVKCNPEWIVCEQDRTELAPKDSVAQSLAYLRKIGL